MSVLSLVHLAAFLGDIALIIFVLSKNFSAWLNRLCALFIFVFALWSLGFCITQTSISAGSALFWMNLSSIGWLTFPVPAMYFYLTLTGKDKIVKNKVLAAGVVIVIAFLFYQLWMDNLVESVVHENYGWSAVWATTPYTYLMYLYFISVFSFIFYLVFNYGRKAKNKREKIQAGLLQWATIISVFFGLILNVLLAVLHITNIPQIGDISVFIWAIGIVICITRYGLMSVTPITAAEQILDTTTDMLLLLEKDGRIKLSNHATLNLLNVREDEINGSYLKSFLVKDEMADILLQKTVEKGKSVNEELILKTKIGKSITALVSASVVKDKTGTAIGFVVSAKDVTELHKTQTAFKQQKELIDRILNTTPSAVLVINGDSIIQFINKAFCDTFQKCEKEIVGKPIDLVLPVDILSPEISKVKSCDEPRLIYELKHSLENQEKIFTASILPMRKGEILVILNDVTDERNTQENLHLTDRLASIGEMASGIAHEINNPLTGIIGLSSLLVEKKIPEDIMDDLLDISKEAQRCAAIVKNLLSFARKHIAVRQPLNALYILEDVIKLRAFDHERNNISVEINFPPDFPRIFADYYQMHQVFLNIILNAETEMIDANRRGTLSITGESIDSKVSISFNDDGPGILTENLRKIFDPFFTTKEVGKGTGLGLSICYGIVKSHGGNIYAKSEYGHGATFVVELPAYREEEQQNALPEQKNY